MREEPLYTPQEVADILGCTRQNIQYHITRGNIEVEKIESKYHFIGHNELKRLKKEMG